MKQGKLNVLIAIALVIAIAGCATTEKSPDPAKAGPHKLPMRSWVDLIHQSWPAGPDRDDEGRVYCGGP